MILVCERFLPDTNMQWPMKLSPMDPNIYFCQDLDLTKIQKINKCETSTAGA
jgi:hypothetical protein